MEMKEYGVMGFLSVTCGLLSKEELIVCLFPLL